MQGITFNINENRKTVVEWNLCLLWQVLSFATIKWKMFNCENN